MLVLRSHTHRKVSAYYVFQYHRFLCVLFVIDNLSHKLNAEYFVEADKKLKTLLRESTLHEEQKKSMI